MLTREDHSSRGDDQFHDTKGKLNSQIINGSRRLRIARGSGTNVQDVNQLLKRYAKPEKCEAFYSDGEEGSLRGGMPFFS